MSTVSSTIKEKLHQYIDSAEERKLHAIYIMLEDEIEYEEDYTDEFKNEVLKKLHDIFNLLDFDILIDKVENELKELQ